MSIELYSSNSQDLADEAYWSLSFNSLRLPAFGFNEFAGGDDQVFEDDYPAELTSDEYILNLIEAGEVPELEGEENVEINEVMAIADELYSVQETIRLTQIKEAELKGQLAIALWKIRKSDDDLPEIIGGMGQRYKLSVAPPKHIFNLPESEFDNLGIREMMTPPPSMNKTNMDKLIKSGVIDYQTISKWQQEGWYVREDSGDLTVKQLQSKEPEVKTF